MRHPNRPVPRTLARPAALVLATALLTGGLTGCDALASLDVCGGTADRVKAMRSDPILQAAPEGAITPKGLGEVEAGCSEDSGAGWLYAERVYAHPGSREKVLDFYRTAADKDGWLLRRGAEQGHGTGRAEEGLCFTRGEDGDTLTLSVHFTDARQLKENYDYVAGPEFDSGAGFEISINSELNGADSGCFD
ncbi:hypothetical protein AB0C52_02340 [Streptomyces sp. NPDC048717]|uniref:hypothetical protein n=1 Tax=Streptomyces sp. NPDC048717 TaxID=3154928 RepID=UPI003436A00C